LLSWLSVFFSTGFLFFFGGNVFVFHGGNLFVFRHGHLLRWADAVGRCPASREKLQRFERLLPEKWLKPRPGFGLGCLNRAELVSGCAASTLISHKVFL
jgi:hypothetical protein